MEINFTTIEVLKNEIQKFREFRERYNDLISGRREPNDDEEELERLGVLSDTQQELENLLFIMKETDEQ